MGRITRHDSGNEDVNNRDANATGSMILPNRKCAIWKHLEKFRISHKSSNKYNWIYFIRNLEKVKLWLGDKTTIRKASSKFVTEKAVLEFVTDYVSTNSNSICTN